MYSCLFEKPKSLSSPSFVSPTVTASRASMPKLLESICKCFCFPTLRSVILLIQIANHSNLKCEQTLVRAEQTQSEFAWKPNDLCDTGWNASCVFELNFRLKFECLIFEGRVYKYEKDCFRIKEFR